MGCLCNSGVVGYGVLVTVLVGLGVSVGVVVAVAVAVAEGCGNAVASTPGALGLPAAPHAVRTANAIARMAGRIRRLFNMRFPCNLSAN